MSRPKAVVPKLCCHRPTGRGYVRLNGRCVYLGAFDDPAIKKRYEKTVAEWLAGGRTHRVDPGIVTVAEVCDRYLAFAREHYGRRRHANKIVSKIRQTQAPLLQTYGDIKAADFTPKKLLAVRGIFVSHGWKRWTVNERVQTVQRMFRWAVVQELVPGTVSAALNAVRGLRAGESDAPEPRKVMPIDDEHVDAVKPFVSRQVAAMLDLMKLTGCRPGEVVIMRGCDIDMTGPVWIYRPLFHKNDFRGKDREVCIGPLAQEVIKPFLRPALEEYLFDPRDAVREKHAACRVHRHQPVEPASTDRTIRDRYDTCSFARAVSRGCDAAFPPPETIKADPEKVRAWRQAHRFGLHRIRHAFATKVTRQHGAELARTLLGHASVLTTAIYVERDRSASAALALKIG